MNGYYAQVTKDPVPNAGVIDELRTTLGIG